MKRATSFAQKNFELSATKSRQSMQNGPRSSSNARREYEWDPKVYANKHQMTVIN